MITGNMLVMFIVGFIIFALYLVGLLTMITKAHKQQRQEMENDPELRDYYNRQHDPIDYDGHGNWGRFNPHAEEKSDSYVKNLFKPKKKKKKENVGKSTFWD